jgi:DnaK suppressor protein
MANAKKKSKAKKSAKKSKAKAVKKKSKKIVKRAAAKTSAKTKKTKKTTKKSIAKKSPAKASKAARKPAPKKKKQIVGEGDYAASRKFDKDQAGFVKRNKAKIPALGKAAEAALDGPEGDSLRAAEQEAMNRSLID